MIRAIVISALLLVGTAAQAQVQPKVAKGPAASLPKLETWTLENGLQVAFLPMPTAPSVTVQVWYHVGSKNEAKDRRGSAHMFEHMMFKGSENLRAEEHARHLSSLGGYVNAFTTEDVTAYHNTLPSEHMDFAVQIEAERMRNLWFRDDMIATEKEVVKEEIRQQENNPLYVGFLRFLEMAFRAHPYSWTAGGDLEDLDATTTEDLKRFYDRYYVPNNALLIVVGKAESKAVRASAEKWFAPIPMGQERPAFPAELTETPQSEKRREVVTPAQIGLVMRGYHIPEAKHPDVHALRVLALILSGGESSRLYEQIVRKQKLAVQAGGQLVIREHPGLMMILGVYLNAAKGNALEAALATEVAKLRKGLVSKAELAKAKKQLQAQLVYGMESVTGIASQIGYSWIQRGDAGQFVNDLAALEAVTSADIRRVAELYLGDAQSTVVVIPPAAAPTSGAK
ncbi:MAG: insulinase family protein [Myxococcales bacterium]|nr:insulinase family protein [Myxococcales bacterium]